MRARIGFHLVPQRAHVRHAVAPGREHDLAIRGVSASNVRFDINSASGE